MSSSYTVVYRPDKEKFIECYINYDFSGGWDQAYGNNAENFVFPLEYIITYTICPVIWCRNLHLKIALNTIESDYIVLIQEMRDIIPFMEIIKEILFIFDINIPKP